MMGYESEFEIIIMVEEKKIMEKEKKIAVIVNEIQKLNLILKQEEEEKNLFRSYMEKNKNFNLASVSMYDNYQEKKKIKEEIKNIEKKLHNERIEYIRMKEKLKAIRQMDAKKEKEYNDELKKKEQRKIISMKNHINNREKE